MKGRLEHKLKCEDRVETKLRELPDYMGDFYSSLQSKEYKTSELYLNYIVRFLTSITKNSALPSKEGLQRITGSHINRYMKLISKTVRNDTIVETSDSYRATVWSALNKFFTFLLRDRVIDENPCAFTERPSIKDVVEKVSMNQEELLSYINNINQGVGSNESKLKQQKWKERDLLIGVLLIETGMRVTALIEINVDDIDLDTKTLTITDKRKTTYTYTLSDNAIDYIKDWMKRRAKLLGEVESSALFISNRKKRMSYGSVNALVEKYSVNINKKITPHKFRSTYATTVYEATGDVYKVQKCMGHSDLKTTQRYIVTNNDFKDEATNIMSSIISKKERCSNDK